MADGVEKTWMKEALGLVRKMTYLRGLMSPMSSSDVY